jgi:NitT/TauT family transport system ATP-binding protein
MVFQHFGLFPWKTVSENICYGLKVQGRPQQEAEAALKKYVKMVGLEGFERAYPYQLSGGMQQRCGLARALAINPKILLMDEPFGAVDAQTREILQEEMLRIWEAEKKTMVFITHSIDEAILLGDRVVVMSPRPGQVRETLKVHLPRPRDINAMRGELEYLRLRNHIWDVLRGMETGAFQAGVR